jgi:ABC-type nitrate/sulfonate/bicarbonate transport system substrate-binding protein
MRLVTYMVVSASIALGALSGPATAQPKKIRIAWNQAPGHMASLLWHDPSLGYLKYHGKTYIAEPINFQGSGHQVQAIAANQLDLAAVSPAAFVAMVKNAGLDAQVIGDVFNDTCVGQNFSQPFYARKEAKIKTLADLRGKRVAINSRGSGTDMMLSAALKKGGVPDAAVTKVEVSFAASVPFLKEGKVDVASFLSQYIPQIDADPNLELIFTACDVLGPTSIVMLVARKGFIAENRAALVDMLADYMSGLQWFTDPKNRDKALEAIASVTKAPKEEFAGWVFTEKDSARSPDLYIDPKIIQSSIDKTVEFGLLKEGITVEPNYVDFSVARDAAEKAGIKRK